MKRPSGARESESRNGGDEYMDDLEEPENQPQPKRGLLDRIGRLYRPR
jgi:hypothetical protein